MALMPPRSTMRSSARTESVPVLIPHRATLGGGMRVALRGASGGFED